MTSEEPQESLGLSELSQVLGAQDAACVSCHHQARELPHVPFSGKVDIRILTTVFNLNPRVQA
jgi:hypothetical protein